MSNTCKHKEAYFNHKYEGIEMVSGTGYCVDCGQGWILNKETRKMEPEGEPEFPVQDMVEDFEDDESEEVNSKIPTHREFANEMVDAFLKEEGIRVETEKDEDPLDVILGIPEIHVNFTAWLCALLRELNYEDVGTPKDTTLN